MSLLTTLKGALGLQRPLVPANAGPLTLSDAAQKRAASLPDGHGIHVSSKASSAGRVVSVDEGELQGPPAPGFDNLTIGDRDLKRMRGVQLDYDGTSWRVAVHLELRARETPNPNGRQYLSNRFLAESRTFHFDAAAPDPPALAGRLLGIPNVTGVLLRDNTVTVERKPDAPWDAIDQGVDAAIRMHFLSLGHRLTGDAVETTGILARVQAVLEQTVLPAIHRDGGDLELVSVTDGVVRVRLQGACRSCPASSATLKLGVERALTGALPGEVERVEQVD